jgi:regulator of sigma E protease
MFSIIVILHEYGHYKTARIFGIHIEEFGLGIPPRAKKLWRNKEGTLFSLNWIPL